MRDHTTPGVHTCDSIPVRDITQVAPVLQPKMETHANSLSEQLLSQGRQSAGAKGGKIALCFVRIEFFQFFLAFNHL